MDVQTKLGSQRAGGSARRVSSGGFLCQKKVSDLLLIDRVICNPYVLDEKEEKSIRQSVYRKHSIHSQVIENPALQNPHQTRPFLKWHQTQSSTGFFKRGFLPAWMKRASTRPSKSLSITANQPPASFPKQMASKMARSSTTSLDKSQTNLLIPEGEVMDSSLIHLSVKKLPKALTDTMLPNRCFLDESSQWMEPEGFLQNDYERKGYKEKLHPDHIQWSRLPRDKYLSKMHNAVQLLSQSEQNNAHIRSGCKVFRALLRRTNQELRFLYSGQSDPEQEALVTQENINSTECLW